MKIAYLCIDPGIPAFGTKGASVHVQEVIRGLRAEGHDVTLYCTRAGKDCPADLADLPVVEIRVGKGPAAEREQHVTRTAAELARAVLLDGCDAVYERYALFSDAGVLVSEILDIPFILEVNAPLIDEQREHRELIDETQAVDATIRSLQAATTVVCVSEEVADWAIGVAPAAAQQVRVINNGVNTTRIKPADHLNRPFTVGFVGTLKPWHGTDLLIRAFAAATAVSTEPWRLVICGDGPERARLENLALELRIDSATTFTGAVAPADIPGVLQRFDVATAPYPPASSDQHYFSPLKLYEYFAAGLPVIASAIGQITEVAEHGHTALLVEPGSVSQLAGALTQLSLDPELRHQLGGAARNQAVNHHDWTSVVRQMLESIEPAKQL